MCFCIAATFIKTLGHVLWIRDQLKERKSPYSRIQAMKAMNKKVVQQSYAKEKVAWKVLSGNVFR